MNQSDILKSAKKIMDSFHEALAKVEKEAPESQVERDECSREEKGAWKSDFEFRKIMFENAPKTSGDCIEAEKGKWTE